MPFASIELYAPFHHDLQTEAATLVHTNHAAYLHSHVDMITVKSTYVQPDEIWFFKGVQLDRDLEPAFYIHTVIGSGTATSVDIVKFVLSTHDQLGSVFERLFPGVRMDDVPSRSKVTVTTTL